MPELQFEAIHPFGEGGGCPLEKYLIDGTEAITPLPLQPSRENPRRRA